MEKNKQIILIGGAPTTGKSTVAKLLSKHLDIPWISTDQIRQILKSVAHVEDYPNLLSIENYTAEKFHTEYSPEQIAEIEFALGEETWIGVKKFIEDAYPWTDSYIIEGVAILPHLVSHDFKENLEIKPIFLIDENADRIRDVVFNRGLWSSAKSYSDELKEKEVEWVQLFSHKIKNEANKYGYPLIEVSKNDSDFKKVLKVLNI
jgi:2-phosphoglycerate kinase